MTWRPAQFVVILLLDGMDAQHFDEELTVRPWAYAPVKRRGASASTSEASELLSENELEIEPELPQGNAWDDAHNIFTLVVLYMIQGVPLGLTFGSVPFLLQESSSYTDIGVFSFAAYPYSLKLLWSPIVDSVFVKGFGRRKSWIVPIQLIVGLTLFLFCETIESYVKPDPVHHHRNIQILTVVFFLIVLLVATQDIAVDGWAITMLSEPNRGLASTCQSVGQNIGFFMSYTVFLALSSADFCNQYLRSESMDVPLVTLTSYMRFWGLFMVIATLILVFFKSECIEADPAECSISDTYKDIFNVIRLPSMQTLLVVLLTLRISFAASDNVTVLKLIEKGFPRERMALMVFITFPFDVLIPIFISKWIRKEENEPLHAFLLAFPVRVAITILGMLVVYTFPTDKSDQTLLTYINVFIVHILYSFMSNAMFVAQCAFFAEICDPRIGGTYMTLMNTIANLGGTWPKFFVLWLVDLFTVKSCEPSEDGTEQQCTIERDGYYVMSIFCALYGVVWFILMRPRINAIQDLDTSVWRLGNEPKKD